MSTRKHDKTTADVAASGNTITWIGDADATTTIHSPVGNQRKGGENRHSASSPDLVSCTSTGIHSKDPPTLQDPPMFLPDANLIHKTEMQTTIPTVYTGSLGSFHPPIYPSSPPSSIFSPFVSSSFHPMHSAMMNHPFLPGMFPTASSAMTAGVGSGIVQSAFHMLYSIQSILFSFGQVVHIVGSNASAMEQICRQSHKLMRSCMENIDSMVEKFLLLTDLESTNLIGSEKKKSEMRFVDQDELKNLRKTEIGRRRLKTLRYSFIFSISIACYKTVRQWSKKRRDYIQFLDEYRSKLLQLKELHHRQ